MKPRFKSDVFVLLGKSQSVLVRRMEQAKWIVNKKWLRKSVGVVCLNNNWVNLLHETNVPLFRLPSPAAVPCEGSRDSVFALLFTPAVLLCAFADFLKLIHCHEALIRQLEEACGSRACCLTRAAFHGYDKGVT